MGERDYKRTMKRQVVSSKSTLISKGSGEKAEEAYRSLIQSSHTFMTARPSCGPLQEDQRAVGKQQIARGLPILVLMARGPV